MKIRSIGTITLLSWAAAAPAVAQNGGEDAPPAGATHIPVFVEVFGNWGVNLGDLPYLPDGPPGVGKYPFASGFGGGALVGVTLLPPWLSLFIDYRYGSAGTVHGNATGALSDIHATLDYNTLTVGLRIERHAGIGSVYAQMAVGALLPFHSTIEQTYDPALAVIGITGKGREQSDYGAGYGVEAEMGYHFDLPAHFYVGTGVRLSAFQSSNNGRDTTLTNFVTDFTAMPPVAETTTIRHDSATASVYSVQDVRLNVSVGYRF